MNDRSAAGRAAVRVVRTTDPAAEAMRLAAELDADVAFDVGVAERAVLARVDAGRAAVDGDPDADEELLGRAPSIREAAAEAPPITDAEVEELRMLAADLERAARIRDRTERRVQEVLQARVAASTGVAIHPEAVAAAAEAVVAAEEALDRAEAAPDAADEPVPGERPGAGEGDDDDPFRRRPEDDFDEASLERRRGRVRAVALVLVAAGAAVVAAALGAPLVVVVPAGVVIAAVVAAAVLRSRSSTAASATGPDAATAPATPRPQPARTPTSEEHADRLAQLVATRDEATERLRVARNRWQQLAGPDADPHDPASVVRAHDPQLAYDERVVGASPTMRTVAAFHRRAQARWKVVWAALGRDEAPPPEALEEVLDELLGAHRDALAELRRLEEAEARAASRAAARRPLILVEPEGWVAPGRLAQLLASVPPDGEVLVLEKN